jgi:hypothetical protein
MRRYTEEELKWIEDNLDAGVFRNQQHFVDVFNALFGTSVTKSAMVAVLSNRGWKLTTYHNTPRWTDEMDEWLRENYPAYDCDFVRMADDFNEVFGTNKANYDITKRLERKGIHKPRKKAGNINKGCFKRGQKGINALPVGTIRYNSDGRPFIKVQECNGESGAGSGSGHNYREPWWKPLQKKIWEDHYGDVPDGYIVCSLNGDPSCTDIEQIGIIDKRGTVRMAKNGWWDIDHTAIKATAVSWCNLYYALKDSERNGNKNGKHL